MNPHYSSTAADTRSRTSKVRDFARRGARSANRTGRDFVWQWQERPQKPTAYNFQRDLLIAGYWLITIAMIAIFFDEMAVHTARNISPFWREFFVFVTGFGKSGYLFLSTGIISVSAAAMTGLASQRDMRAAMGVLAGRALFVFAVLLVSGIASLMLKRIGRARPKLMEQGGPFQFDPLALDASWASLPSGHTITIFAFAVAMGYFLPRWRVPLLLIAVLVGISRVVIGAHYPSDVVAGACIGTASAVLLRRLFAARNIVFSVRPGKLVARGQGVIMPSLRNNRRI